MKKIILPFIFVAALGACSDTPEKKLDGDRLSLYDFEKTLQSGNNTQFGMDGTEGQSLLTLPTSARGGVDDTINLVAPWDNKFWPQAGGYPTHAMKHVAFTKDTPKKAWSASIGKGSTDRMPLTSSPIMADGKIFTLNNDVEIYAFNAQNGKKIWQQDIIKKGEDEPVIGGGIAFSGGKIFATNGFNELVAINATDGQILWRTDTKIPVRAAPSALLDRVFVTTMDNQTIAFNSQNGEKIWSHRGLSSEAGILGAATPAIGRDVVISAYGSGEVYALQMDTGLELWSENLSPLAKMAGQTSLSDIRALPVIDGGQIYAASYSDRMSAIDERTGQPVWSKTIGTGSTPWVSGNRIYIIESQGAIVSMNRNDGDVIWQSPLPAFEDEKDREGVIRWKGPYLAGERLIAIGSHGIAQSYNPVDGTLIDSWKTDGDIRLSPAFANGVMYTVSKDGKLAAWK